METKSKKRKVRNNKAVEDSAKGLNKEDYKRLRAGLNKKINKGNGKKNRKDDR